MLVASVRARFDHALMLCYVRNDRFYKCDTPRICKGITAIIAMKNKENLRLNIPFDGTNSPFAQPEY